MNFPFLDPIEINRVRDAVNTDAEFRLASRFFSKDILLVAGDSKCIVNVREGVVIEIKLNPSFMNPWSFFIKGGTDAWESSCAPFRHPFSRTCTAAFRASISSWAAISKPPSRTFGR